jgi:hypothetical protein
LSSIFEHLAGFFGNESVGAFIGAACGAIFTYATVAITDRRRDHQVVETIRREIETGVDAAAAKLEAAEDMLLLMRQHRQIKAGEVLAFDLALINELKARVLHRLEPAQRLALDGVVHRMHGVNRLLDDVHQQQEAMRPRLAAGQPVSSAEMQLLDGRIADAIVNIKVLRAQAASYIKGDHRGVAALRFTGEEYGPKPLRFDYAAPAAAAPGRPEGPA